MTRLMLTLWLYSLEFIDDKVDVDPEVDVETTRLC